MFPCCICLLAQVQYIVLVSSPPVLPTSVADPDPIVPHHFAGSGSGSIIFSMDPDPDLNQAHFTLLSLLPSSFTLNLSLLLPHPTSITFLTPPPSPYLNYLPHSSSLIPHPSSLTPQLLLPHPSSFIPRLSSLIRLPSTLLPFLFFLITHLSSLIPHPSPLLHHLSTAHHISPPSSLTPST